MKIGSYCSILSQTDSECSQVEALPATNRGWKLVVSLERAAPAAGASDEAQLTPDGLKVL